MGHPVLRQVTAPVPASQLGSDWLVALVGDLEDTLRASGGIGLAAPQIAESHRVAIIEIADGPSRYGQLQQTPLTVYINPTIEVLDTQPQAFFEGCLSIPGLRGNVERPRHIRVCFQDLDGQNKTEEYEGFLATVFQHEFDHLDGRLFIDRMKDMTKLSFEAEFEQFQQQAVA